jgi:hypothetical protein
VTDNLAAPVHLLSRSLRPRPCSAAGERFGLSTATAGSIAVPGGIGTGTLVLSRDLSTLDWFTSPGLVSQRR